MALKNFTLGLAVFWTVLIATLCLVKFNDLPSFGVRQMDKYVHFTFHFVFTILWSYYFFVLYDKVNFKIVLGIVLLSFIYGVLIEILQETFTLTRHADVVDVIANSAGAITAFVFLMIVKNKTSYLS